MKISRHSILGFALLPLLASVVCGRGAADVYTYASNRHVVNVGILVSNAIPGKSPNENPDPHVFYVLDSRTDLKPSGLDIENPLAPPVITSAIYQRWQNKVSNDKAFQSGTEESAKFRIGARVTKDMGCYWEVNLDDVTAKDLAGMDLLYLHTHNVVTFTPDQREKLRKYVEGGGTLWLEDCGGFRFDPNAPFLMDAQFHQGDNGSAVAIMATPQHPVLSYPFAMTPNEIQNIGDKHVNDYYVYRPDTVGGAGPGSNDTNPPGGQTLAPLIWNTRGFNKEGTTYAPGADWRPYWLAGPYGSGRLVFSSSDTGCAINDYVGGSAGANAGAVSGNVLSSAHAPDCKLVYNLLYWASSHMTDRSDSRRTGSSGEQVGSVMRESFAAPVSTTPTTYRVGSPAIYQHCIFSVDGDLVLHCYDQNPNEDLDNDGNPDDGGADYSKGAQQDEVWRFDLKQAARGAKGVSAPTIVDFFDSNASNQSDPPALLLSPQRALVVLQFDNGTVIALRAFPRDKSLHLVSDGVVDWTFPKSGSSSLSPVQTPIDYTAHTAGDLTYDSPLQDMPVPSPAFADGVIFVTENSSTGVQIVPLDPRTGTNAFFPGQDAGTAAVPKSGSLQFALTSPAVGFVTDQANGADDRVAYVTQAGVAASSLAASVNAYWFSTCNERLLQRDPDAHTFRSRADKPWFDATQSGANTLLRARVYCKTGDNNTPSIELTYVAGGTADSLTGKTNSFTFAFDAQRKALVFISDIVVGNNAAQAPNSSNLTFFADYTLDWTQTTTPVAARTALLAPDPGFAGHSITGAPCLTPDDQVIYTVNTNPTGGTTSTTPSVVMAANEQLMSSSNKSTLKWAYLTDHLGPFTRLQFVGSAAYRGDTAYVVAHAIDSASNGRPVSLLCAFKTNQSIVLKLGQSFDPNTMAVYQLNPMFGDITAGGGRVDLDKTQYTADGASGTITINSLATLQNGGLGTRFAANSLSFWVQLGTASPVEITPSAGNFDNLQWYVPIPTDIPNNVATPRIEPAYANGTSFATPGYVCSSPVVQGDTVWLGTTFGYIIALASNPGQSVSVGTGQQLDFSGGNGIARWVRGLERPSGGANAAISSAYGAAVGATGVVATAVGAGLDAFEDRRTIIADNNRIVEVDSAGSPTWVCDGTRGRAFAGGPEPPWLTRTEYNINPNDQAFYTGVPMELKVPFRNPNVVRRLTLNDFLVVDTGNNRVVQIDRRGMIAWEVSAFQDPYKCLPQGDPLALNGPTDCTYWTEVITSPATTRDGKPLVVGSLINHFLIADAGNFRAICIRDSWQPDGTIVENHVVEFVSQTPSLQSRKYRFATVERLYTPKGIAVVSAVSNYRVAASTDVANNQQLDASDSVGGSLMVMDSAGIVNAVLTDLKIPGQTQPIVNPTFFSRFSDTVVSGNKTYTVDKYLLCDANGCYQLYVDPTDPQKKTMAVEWMMTASDYYLMTGKRLAATSIRRLDVAAPSPNVKTSDLHQFLITNRFSGTDDPAGAFGIGIPQAFGGEVFILDPSAFTWADPLRHGYRPSYIVSGGHLVAYPAASIVWRVPAETPMQTSSGDVLFRALGDSSNGKNTSLLQQPSSADQPF